MVAKNMKDLEKMLMDEMKNAMDEVSIQAQKDMEDAIQHDFYEKGTPVMYVRTHKMSQTPQISQLSVSDSEKTVQFEASLNQSGGYDTGCKPSMSAVLQLTNTGHYPYLRPAAGGRGYWEKAENRMEKSLNTIMSAYFG